MNENIKSTSVEAYGDHVRQGKASSQRERILASIQDLGPVSRRELADLHERGLGVKRPDLRHFPKKAAWVNITMDHVIYYAVKPAIPLASICGRVRALLDSGLIKVVKIEEDPKTGKMVEYLEAVEPEPVQKSFDDYLK